MKTQHILPILLAVTGALHAQGPLTPPAPPGAPGSEMKSLQQIWDKIGGLETQLSQVQSEIANVRADNIALSGLLAASNVSLPWLITTVDSAGDVGADPSLAFDSKGKPCVAYYDVTLADLKFATLETNGWQVTTVDSTGNVGFTPSLAFGPDGRPSIAYTDVTNSRVKYMRHDGTAWQPTLVAEAGATLPSLAFGPDGKPAIAYRLGTAARLARLDGTWSTEAVSVEPVVSRAVLAFDLRNGMPVVAYQVLDSVITDQFGTNLDYEAVKSVFDGASWSRNVIGTEGNGGFSPSIKAGPGAAPSIAHIGSNNRSAGAGLKFEHTIVLITDYAHNPSLAFGVTGKPAISFYQSDSGDLKFMEFDGSVWVPSTVDTAGDVGIANSLAFGPDGQPAIAYYDATNGNLKFARKGLFRSTP